MALVLPEDETARILYLRNMSIILDLYEVHVKSVSFSGFYWVILLYERRCLIIIAQTIAINFSAKKHYRNFTFSFYNILCECCVVILLAYDNGR